MASFHINHIFPRRIAVIRTKLKVITSKVQRTASSIGFIEKCLKIGIVPVFARVKGQFLDEKDKNLNNLI